MRGLDETDLDSLVSFLSQSYESASLEFQSRIAVIIRPVVVRKIVTDRSCLYFFFEYI